jgi:ferredoxin-NADP reductase/Na+-translocating ferredoxin:NAD+ oxidoreductase RnfD subunit
MISRIDAIINRITMYRLVLFYLIFLLGVALALSFGGALPYDPFALLFSIGFLVGVCGITNTIFAKAFSVPANSESVSITALILALIITPITGYHDLWFLGWAGVLAMASKYMLAIKRKHLFNPAALAVALTALAIDQTASWWVGTPLMLPFVLIGGLVIIRKIRRFGMVASFSLVVLVTVGLASLLNGESVATGLENTLLYSPLLFFACVILTEPLTAPPTNGLQIIYGGLVGVLFTPVFHIGALFTSPESAILLGNVFAYLVSPKAKLVLQLKQKLQIAPDIYDFIFVPQRKLAFAPGQYMEWTLGHQDADSRGNRRYFTLASAPTENNIRIGVKFSQESSSFKQAMLAMDEHTEIVAGQLAGDFVLPRDPQQKCVFIAGGIGITPFRSMIKYLLDTHQQRPIVLLYASRSASRFVYQDVFAQAQRELGLKTIYRVTDPAGAPAAWNENAGRITPELIKREIPDYRDCVYYISGPPTMVASFKHALGELGIAARQIKTDLFPGLPY